MVGKGRPNQSGCNKLPLDFVQASDAPGRDVALDPSMIRRHNCLKLMYFRPLTILATAALAVTGLAASKEKAGTQTIEFNRDIRPILSDNCFA